MAIFSKKKISILFLAFFSLIFFFFLSSEFSVAKIEIWPKIEEKNFEKEILADLSLEKANFKENKFPAKIFEIEKEFEKNFLATGKALKKAQGKIRLYNAYSPKSEIWKEKTRFMSAEGKIFLSKKKIFVPGAKIKNGKLEPSFVDVEVEALEGGKDYNIGPSKFSVIAFKGTQRYFKFWGESFEPMKGGGEISVVKKEDLENAFKSLIEEIEKKEEILKEFLPKGKIFPKKAIFVEVLEKSFSAKEGEEVSGFNLKIKAKMKTIVLNQEDLEKFLKENFYSQLKEKEILKNGEKFEILALISNFETGKFLILLKLSLKCFDKIDQNLLKKEIVGKNKREALKILKNLSGIKKVEIKIFPFFFSKIPENLKKIEILIKY